MEFKTQEEMLLLNEMFDLKAKLRFPIRDKEQEEKMLQRISEIREKLVDIEVERLIKGNEEEMRTMKNGKF